MPSGEKERTVSFRAWAVIDMLVTNYWFGGY